MLEAKRSKRPSHRSECSLAVRAVQTQTNGRQLPRSATYGMGPGRSRHKTGTSEKMNVGPKLCQVESIAKKGFDLRQANAGDIL